MPTIDRGHPLKRGGSKIDLKDLRQGQDYAYLLKEKRSDLKATKIIVWAIGSECNENAREQVDSQTHIECYSTNYRTLVRRANSRLFNLKRKIEEETGYSLVGDKVINDLIKAGIQTSFLT